MRKIAAILLTVSFLLGAVNVQAQTAPVFLGQPGLKQLNTSDIKVHKNAYKVDGSNVQLTSAVNRQAGSAEMPPIWERI